MSTLDAILSFVDGTPEAQLAAVIDRSVRTLRAAGVDRAAVEELKRSTSTGRSWLRAALLDAMGSAAESQAAYRSVTTAVGLEIPDILLRLARFAERAGDVTGAANLLLRVLRLHPSFPLLVRAENLVRKCQSAIAVRRQIRVALVGSCTTTLFRSVLDLLLLRDGIKAEFYEAPFGAYRQEIVDPKSGLYRFNPDFVVVLLHHEDLGLVQLFCDPDAGKAAAADTLTFWDCLLGRTSARILQPSFNLPHADSALALSSLMPGGRTRTILNVNLQLMEAAPTRVTVIDTVRLAAVSTKWEDPAQWSASKLYPATEAYPLLAEHLTSCIRADLGLSSKVLVLDLDNTLWGGVIGEDGLGGIKLGPPSAIGERYQVFQKYLQTLRGRGIPLAVVSKNNYNDAVSVFEKHDASVLRISDFASFQANWDDKASNLCRIASELSLGLEAFVFLDDNPAERAVIRSELPNVIVPEISGEPSESIAALERGLYFQALQFTPEDNTRSESYTARVSAENIRRKAANVDEYLAGLGMEIQTGPVDEVSLVRVTQLINKTNQFNLTTARYTEEELRSKAQSGNHWFQWFRVRDRFADHGLVGIILAGRNGEAWAVDLWLMSCRVIGRGIEDFMFNTLISAAQSAGAARINARYIPSAKNELVRDLLPGYGFVALPGTQDRYELMVDRACVKSCVHLKAA